MSPNSLFYQDGQELAAKYAKQGHRKYRIHLLITSWLPVSEHYQSCAFTQKAIKFSKMMLSLGHEVYIYGAKSEISPVPPCTEFIEIHTMDDIRKVYGEGDNRFELGYDWTKKYGFKIDEDGTDPHCRNKFYTNAIEEIKKRKKPGDILCLTFGPYYKELAEKVGIEIVCEYGIGYPNTFAPYRAYESSYIQNWTYGKQDVMNIRTFDRIIPNYFDPNYFPFVDRDGKKDYLLYVGRIIPRKGIYIAIRLAEASKTKLLLAGQGDMTGKSEWVEYVGWADIKKRAELMSHAKAVLVPTVYLEPFGGVNVEAQLCGTPVITSNFGGFTETVIQGVTGFRCNTFDQYIEAVSKVDQLDPKVIRKHAEQYLMDNVKWMYQAWFDDITNALTQIRQGKEPYFFKDNEVDM